MNSKLPRAGGFTLVELIVAMAFFSFMMMFVSIGVLQISRIYQAGVASRRTQGAARFAVEEITREVRNSNRITSVTSDKLCLDGPQALEFSIVNNSLVKYQGPCNGTGPQTILIDGSAGFVKARLLEVTYFNAGGQDVSVRFRVTVTSGADDQFSDVSKTICLPGVGAEYCSSTTYSNTVSLRGTQ